MFRSARLKACSTLWKARQSLAECFSEMTKMLARRIVCEMPHATVPDLLARAQQHGDRTALVDCSGSYSYAQLLEASSRVAATLLNGQDDLHEQRVAFLISPGFPWVAVQWGIWRAGGIAVPLPLGTPWAELEYYIDDTQASALVYDAANEQCLEAANAKASIRTLPCSEALASQPVSLPAVANPRRAMILYTS